MYKFEILLNLLTNYGIFSEERPLNKITIFSATNIHCDPKNLINIDVKCSDFLYHNILF